MKIVPTYLENPQNVDAISTLKAHGEHTQKKSLAMFLTELK